MMKSSDFAQKLLNDLRVRKEQLSISQNCQTRDNYAYSNGGSKETRAKTTTFQDFNSGGSKSNQIIAYGKGRSIEKTDLSKALAFALENAGKVTGEDPSGNASIISFLHEVGKRSLGYGTTAERRSSQQASSSSQQLPMIHVHIKEISKGAQKLNQIIKACRSGLSFRKGRYSLQRGEELMEGAIELDQSLRLLVEIQQASGYTTNKQRKNRIMLLEENDDDAPNQNYHKIKQVAKSDIEMRLLALKYPEDKNNKHSKRTSSCQDTEQRSLNPHKGRIPNVVAKLMGLGEFPKDEKEIKDNNDASIKSAENSTRQASDNLVELKAERNLTSLDLANHEEIQDGNGISYKAKSPENSRKRKKDGEMMKKNVIRKKSSPTENKHGRSKRSHHKLSFEKKLLLRNSEEQKSVEKDKSQRERHQENGVMTNHSQKPLSSMDIQTKLPHKAKPLRKSFMHKPEILEKKYQDISNTKGSLCKVTKPPENQKSNSKEEDGRHDQLLTSNLLKTEAETCIDTCEVPGIQSSNKSLVEHRREIKDDSILLITADRVPCQAPQDNHHGFMFTGGRDQQALIPKSDGNSERLPKTVLKGTNIGEVEPGLPLLVKRLEYLKPETTEILSENEINLKNIMVKSQVFLDTAEALFKLNIPLNVLHDVGGSNYNIQDKNLILDCGYELIKRKGRFQELSVHPFVKVPVSSSKVNSLDHLVRQLSQEFEKLRAYGRDCYTGSLVEDYLSKVLERDVHHKDTNLNSMWDMGWNNLMLAFIEKDDVVRDIEREVFSALLEEITRDLICI